MSAQVIAALRRRAAVLEADAKIFRTDREVAFRYAPTVGDAAVVNPALLRFVAAEFRALADEAEGYEPKPGPPFPGTAEHREPQAEPELERS